MLTLRHGDVHVWFRKTTALGRELEDSTDVFLSTEERARRDRFVFDADRRDFAVAHDLLRRRLSTYGDIAPQAWQFVTNAYGKPRIESDDPDAAALTFSLAHTRGCVSCAIASNAPVGVDVERVDRSRPFGELAERYFSSDEAAWVRRECREVGAVRFVELWTLKEAFLKALGLGLSGSLADVSFRFDEPAGIIATGSGIADEPGWHFGLFEPDLNLRLAVAIRSVVPPSMSVREDGEWKRLQPIRASW